MAEKNADALAHQRRAPKPTERAVEEKIHRLKGERKGKLAQLTKQRNDIEILKHDECNVDIIKEEALLKFERCFVEYKHINEELWELLSEDDQKVDQEAYESRHAELKAFIQETSKWVVNIKRDSQDEEDEVRPHDSVSAVNSVTSRASQLSSTSSVRLKLKAEREALLARAAAMKMKQELEQEEVRLRVKKEQWQIETELAASNAKLKVYEEFEDVHESMNDLLEPVSRPRARTRSFIRAFEHAIDSKTDSQQDRLYYLEQFTSGEPLDLIRSCEHMRPDRAYREARALLDCHYGDELTIANAYIKKAMEWPQIKPEDRKGLNTFALFLIGCCNAVNDVDYMDEMNNPTNMKCILSKLPFKLKEKWRSYAYDIKERRKKRARFPDLVDFVYHQAKVVNDPLFGDILDATIGNQGNSKKKANVRKSETKRSSFAVSVSAMDKDATKGQPERKPPAVNLANAFQSPCLYSGHLSKDCKKRASCPDCSLKHPAILHVVKEDPTLEKNRDGNSKDTAEASRGLRIESFMSSKSWFQGPSFLSNENEWPEQPKQSTYLPEHDKEVKTSAAVLHTSSVVDNIDPVNQLVEYYSSWHKLKKATAWILHLREMLQYLSEKRKEFEKAAQQSEHDSEKCTSVVKEHMITCKKNLERKMLTVEDFSKAEMELIKYSQRQTYAEEIKVLRQGHTQSAMDERVMTHLREQKPRA
ncbi:hypothetical protein MHYP_G00194020 [Metynnis hypsauchen]